MKWLKVRNSVGVFCYTDMFILKQSGVKSAELMMISLFGTEAEVKSVTADFLQGRGMVVKLESGDNCYVEKYYYDDKYAVAKQKLRTNDGRSFLNAVIYNKTVLERGELIITDTEDEVENAIVDYFDNKFPTVPIPEHIKKDIAFQFLGDEIFYDKEKDDNDNLHLITFGIDKRVALIRRYAAVSIGELKETIKNLMQERFKKSA